MNPVCQYCHKSTHHKPLPEMKIFGVEVYFCFTCSAEYLIWQNGNIGSVSLYTTINERIYRWSMAGNRHTLWHVEIPGVPGVSTNKTLQHVLSLSENDVKPVMTPDNVQEKLRTYLNYL